MDGLIWSLLTLKKKKSRSLMIINLKKNNIFYKISDLIFTTIGSEDIIGHRII